MTASPMFDGVRYITFDCYGTLIDWESGIVRTLSDWLTAQGRPVSTEEILQLYAHVEPEEQGGVYRRYRDILISVQQQFARRFNITVRDEDRMLLADSLKTWKPFPDTCSTLEALSRNFKLAVISNIDDDLFEATRRQMPPVFADVITAEQVGSYKPSLRNFRVALDRLGCQARDVLHVAESLFHDIHPCNELGIRCVWVNRKSKNMEVGATRASQAVPDAIISSLAALLDIV